MRRIVILSLILASYGLAATAQQCNCKASYEWMVQTFEKNDAGFQYVIDKKGAEDYQKYKAQYLEKIRNVTNVITCGQLLYKWLLYFRPGHIAVLPKSAAAIGSPAAAGSKDSIRQVYKNTRTIGLSQKQLLADIEKKKNKNPVEGIWSSGAYTIGIVAEPENPGKYAGFILKADSVYWMPGQVKTELTLNDDHRTFTADFYMRNHAKQAATASLVSTAGNLLLLNNDYWVRSSPGVKLTDGESALLSFLRTRVPYAQKLSAQTVYLRIPSFAAEQKVKIDSVLARYDSLIKATPNLIIDIRSGTGGSDASYRNILPYLYTNPIRQVSLQLYATELNAQGYDKFAKQYTDTADRNYCLRIAQRMREHLGGWINNSSQLASLDTLKTVLPYPRKVAILINHGNGSTDEQFLLDAKQSSKVKVFGKPTFGALDISNMNYIDFPDGNYQLGICMSKSYRIPDLTIDGVGIQPDYFLDDTIKVADWVDYSRSVLEY